MLNNSFKSRLCRWD